MFSLSLWSLFLLQGRFSPLSLTLRSLLEVSVTRMMTLLWLKLSHSCATLLRLKLLCWTRPHSLWMVLSLANQAEPRASNWASQTAAIECQELKSMTGNLQRKTGNCRQLSYTVTTTILLLSWHGKVFRFLLILVLSV